MNKILALSAALAVSFVGSCPPVETRAADLPVKALTLPRVASPCTVAACSGFYVGVDAAGLNSNLDIIGSGLAGSIGAGGMQLGVHAGYQAWNGPWFGAVEVGASYDMLKNIPAVGGSVSNRFLTTELVKVGGMLGALFGAPQPAQAAPSQGPVPINVPSALANSLVSPYMILGAAQRFSKTGFVSGAGMQFVVSQNVNASVDYLHIQYNHPQVTPLETLDTENIMRASINYHF